jgi:2-polyprenyl-3-methyl-5-hydroxy-6-metoxy-1,4-benzoquinol methylase
MAPAVDTRVEPEAARWLGVLRGNCGFQRPELWVPYAREHRFEAVRAARVEACPDCGHREAQRIGQYVWYSSLVRLRLCEACALVYADVRIDDEVVQEHFETAYKDEEYFVVNRRDIFDDVCRLVDRHAPAGGTVIDIGGGKGHLMARVKERRPDLRVVVNDVSREARQWARSKYGLEVAGGRAVDLESWPDRFDVATALDVIYYEPEISRLWRVLGARVRDGGTVILRVPNTWGLIRWCEWWRDRLTRPESRMMATRVVGLNPEYLFVFSRSYLVSRLRGLGFTTVDVRPSPLPVRGSATRWLGRLGHSMAKAVHAASGRRLVVTPSMIVVGHRTGGGHR